MVSMGALGLSAFVVLAYMAVARAECPATSRGKLDACVATFSTANLFNREHRLDRIKMGNTSCPVDILDESCTSFDFMIDCVNVAGFPSGCEDEFNKELTNQDFQCTYLELGVICPDADVISGATSVAVSMFLVGASVMAAFYNRL